MKRIIFTIVAFVLFTFSVFSQENCSNAVEITFEEYSTCGQIAIINADLTDAVPSADLPLPECGNFDSGTNDLWYYITVPDGVTELAFHVFNPPIGDIYVNFKPALAVYSGSPDNLSLLNCFYNDGGVYTDGEIKFSTIDGLTPGQTLYLRVWDMGNNDFTFYVAASVRTEIPEHSCESPALLTDGGCNILAPKGTIDPPVQCGWNVSDNTIFYYFVVTAEDSQPITINANYVFCFENGSTTEDPEETELQMAIYKWNEVDCTGIGGSDESTYFGCNNGTGNVSLSAQLDPGAYILAVDGYSTLSGNSLCTFEFSTNFTNGIISFNNALNSKSKIFPNPASNSFVIELNKFPANVQIFDLNGKLIKTIDDYSGEDIDICELQKGIYLVKVFNEMTFSTEKLIVE